MEPESALHVAGFGDDYYRGMGMAHESHDYKAIAGKLRQLARQVQSDYCRDQLLQIAQGFDRLAKHAEEWPAAPKEDWRFL